VFRVLQRFRKSHAANLWPSCLWSRAVFFLSSGVEDYYILYIIYYFYMRIYIKDFLTSIMYVCMCVVQFLSSTNFLQIE